MNVPTDTIVAPATASGGAIAVIRLSGPEAIACCDRIFRGRKPLAEAAGHTLHYGEVIDGDRMIDDVVAAIYRAPHSYTGEDAVELSCHGSHYIVSEIIALLLRSGARMAQPGEFTIRAFLAGRMDLAQAEAVADLIASDSRASHAMASTQMRGGYSAALGALRDELLQLASLLELELDFSEEDVQFADRARLREMMLRIESEITRLTDSFKLGNAIKKGGSRYRRRTQRRQKHPSEPSAGRRAGPGIRHRRHHTRHDRRDAQYRRRSVPLHRHRRAARYRRSPGTNGHRPHAGDDPPRTNRTSGRRCDLPDTSRHTDYARTDSLAHRQ